MPPTAAGPTALAGHGQPEARPEPSAADPHVLRSEDLLQGRREVQIVHGGLRYRLSLTSMGKLILTK